MKRISIRELHDATGKWVRESARVGELVVTERGRPIATIALAPAPVALLSSRHVLSLLASLGP